MGTSRQPFKQMRVPDENGLDKVESMKHTYRKLKLNCLVILGGNGSQKTANLLSQEGLNVVSLPKTIDNDLWGTDMTFGFHSAVEVAANAIDCIHTTAASHGRVFIVEVMGHKVGWLTLTQVFQGELILSFFLRFLMTSMQSATPLQSVPRQASASLFWQWLKELFPGKMPV